MQAGSNSGGTGTTQRAQSFRLASIAFACAAAFVLGPASAAAQRYVATSDSLHPRIKYADSLTSANDRCMVALGKLNLRVRPVYVNGVPMGFC